MFKTLSQFACNMFLVGLLSASPLYGQDFITNEAPFPLQSYAMTSSGEVRVILETDDMFLSWELPVEAMERELRIDTTLIEKRLSENDFVVRRKGSSRFALMHRTIKLADSLITVNGDIRGKSVAEVEEKFKNEGLTAYASLREQHLYSKAKITLLKASPGLDEITREDLLTCLQWREAIGGKIKAFFEDNPDTSPYRASRLVENYRNQQLIRLGYNPYKQVVYNFEKQFEGDEEVIQLLTQPISFDE